MTTIGIDLGTTNSCVAAFRNGRVEIIANDLGSRVTPSYVSFTDTERLVGEPAKDDAKENYKNTLCQIKRLIGRKYNDPVVQADMKMWGFDVINDDNKPKIPVVHSHARKIFTPEQISAMVLEDMKNTAEAYLGKPVTGAVITVPAYFNDAQRKATRDAGEIAGLNVIGMINEPTAAALAYGLDRQSKQERKVLIFDLGGGTFDVTIVKITDQKFEVLATGGDTHLGGEDFDNNLLEHFVGEFSEKYGEHISENKKAIIRLRVKCEQVKRNLTSSTRAKIQLDSFHAGLDFCSNITRAKFENINISYFNTTLETVTNTLSDAGLEKSEIDEVVLVGGSTRIPKIREMLQKFFEGKELKRTINPDEAVAHGAAVYAKFIADGEDGMFEDFVIEDVISLSIGLEANYREMHVVIPRNTKIPTKTWIDYVTLEDNQTSMELRIFEGERALTQDNNLLGELEIFDIPPAPREEGKIRVCFDIDVSGILYVTAVEKITGNSKEISIERNRGNLSKKEILQMIKEANELKSKDEELKQRSKAMNELEDLAYSIKEKIAQKDVAERLPTALKHSMSSKVTAILHWLDLNKEKTLDMSAVEVKRTDLERISHVVLE